MPGYLTLGALSRHFYAYTGTHLKGTTVLPYIHNSFIGHKEEKAGLCLHLQQQEKGNEQRALLGSQA